MQVPEGMIEEARRNGWGDRAEKFAAWMVAMKRIANRLLGPVGITVDDLPDWDFASHFECGDTPTLAAKSFVVDMLAESGMTPDDVGIEIKW